VSRTQTINPERITLLNELVANAQTFVRQVYLPDVLAIAGFYPEWFQYGAGIGNYMTYGDYSGDSTKSASGFSFPRGIVLGRDLSTVLPLDPTM
jgi:hydrogenase large subunit